MAAGNTRGRPGASWRLASLPPTLEPGQVQVMLDGCDTGTACGRRDLAMLTLLARLGLRAGEAAALNLDDIDWRAGEITVTGKGRRSERLPLPADVGEAIAVCLHDGRPEPFEGTRRVFLRIRAPHRGLTAGGVTQAVFAAAQRAGLGRVYAHRLRHTAATGMLRAGASLPEIGQVLRHRRLLSTGLHRGKRGGWPPALPPTSRLNSPTSSPPSSGRPRAGGRRARQNGSFVLRFMSAR